MEPEKDKIEIEKEDDGYRISAYIKPKDWLGDNNFFSRAIIAAVIITLLYSFWIGNVALASIAAWLIIAVFVLISVGINSLKIIVDAIIKIKGD